jgi:hypothetical protein
MKLLLQVNWRLEGLKKCNLGHRIPAGNAVWENMMLQIVGSKDDYNDDDG